MTTSLQREVVALSNRRGETLHLVVTRPRDARPARAVLFCQAGLQNKSGVGDYFRWLGDRLAEHGCAVVRYDQAGTGDSEGEVEQGIPINEYFRKVQSGLGVDDAEDLLAWIEQTLDPRQIILLGQCGGCITALMACARRPARVAGLILLALPVLYSTVETKIRIHDAHVARRGYLAKLTRLESYLRLLQGKSDIALIRASILSIPGAMRRRVMRRIDKLRQRAQPNHPEFNQRLWEAFLEAMSRQVKICFLMAALDNETPDFNSEFRYKVLDNRPEWQERHEISYLDNADHSLMFAEARDRSQEAILGWLDRL